MRHYYPFILEARMKSYYNCCGFCKYMNLYSGYKMLNGMHFKCEKNGYGVRADEKTCNRFEPDRNRTNELIEKYT